ncbi:MAG TPA: hypothetical protein VMD29_12850 [Terracidiphilus sp.]|nr:hypothetical protein [Terracidiphilus sp.]
MFSTTSPAPDALSNAVDTVLTMPEAEFGFMPAAFSSSRAERKCPAALDANMLVPTYFPSSLAETPLAAA